jgi:hypothetical protein
LANPARVVFDHAQRRTKRVANVFAVQGLDWSSSVYQNAWVDPVTKTLMIRPMCEYVAWYTSNSGIYAKPTIGGGLEVLTSASWFEEEVYTGAGKWQRCDNSSSEYIRTSSAVGINRGVCLSYFNYSAGDAFLVLECGWSNSATPTAATASVGLKIYSDGSVYVYKSTEFVTEGKITPTTNDNKHVRLCIIPCRRRELLVVADGRSGFSAIFDDIEETDTSPDITPNEKFFVISPGGGNLKVQLAPLKFEATGYAASKVYTFGRPPKTGDTLASWVNPVFTTITNASLYGDKAYAGTTDVSAVLLTTSDGATAFTPNSTDTEVCLRVTMSSDGSYTPFIYAGAVEYPCEVVDTDDSEEIDVTQYIEPNFTLSIPDDAFGATLSAQLIDPNAVEYDEGVTNITIQNYRPVKLETDDCVLLDAFMKRPRYADGLVDETTRLQFQAETIETLMTKLVFRARVPMDCWPLCEPSGFCAVRWLLQQVGIDNSLMRLSSLGYTISEIPSADGSEFNVAAEVNDTVRDVFDKLLRLCADCVYGPHPGENGLEFWFYAPDDLPQEPVVTLYRTIEDAMAADETLTEEQAWDLLYYDFYEEPLEVEANEIVASGIDPRSGDLIQAYIIDEESQDPTLPPSMRPDNWAGIPLIFSVASRSIRSDADAERVVDKLVPIATDAGKVAEWKANCMLHYTTETDVSLPVWRMDLVNLDGVGERRVSSLNCRFLREMLDAPNIVARDASYTGGTILGRGGSTVASIQSAAQSRMARRGINKIAMATAELRTATRRIVLLS